MNLLSPSKIKTFSSCSEIYAAKYLDKIPDNKNSGSVRGSIVHELFELYINRKKYEKTVNKIIQTNELPKSAIKFITKKLKDEGFFSEENLNKCKNFVLTGLKNDFYCESGELQPPEEHFEIGEGYKIQGFIDQYAIYFDGVDYFAIVKDFKSQRQKFTNQELENNLQGFTYLLAVKNKHPKINIFKSYVKFILLDFPEDPIQIFKLKNQAQIDGFESYLKYMNELVDKFGHKNRKDNLAAKKGHPKPEDGFSGLLMCGIGVSYAGELKKDGKTPKYYCSFRFPFEYFVAIKDGEIKYRSKTKSDLDKYEKLGYSIETRKYKGCPHWNKEDIL